MTIADLENDLIQQLTSLLASAKLVSPECLEAMSRRMITVGGSGYCEAMGNRVAAECFYRMADALAVGEVPGDGQ